MLFNIIMLYQGIPDEFRYSIDRRKRGTQKSNRKYKKNDKLENLYWKIVKNHINGKYSKVKSFLEKLSDDEIEQFLSFEHQLADDLFNQIVKYKIKLDIGGDDSYINLCYNVISHGKTIYYNVLKNPNILYKESELAHEGSGEYGFIINYFML